MGADRVGISRVDKTIQQQRLPTRSAIYQLTKGNRREWNTPFRTPGGSTGGREQTMWGIWLRHQRAHLRWSAAHLSGAGPSKPPQGQNGAKVATSARDAKRGVVTTVDGANTNTKA